MADATLEDGSPPPNPLEPSLTPDARVAGRYRIVRFLARGGMGEVYEAEDLTLGERIALKTLRTLGADDGSSRHRALERFKREVQLARKVTHPNVCRIFDFGVDERLDTRLVFLTMELLDGESLSQRIARGRLSPAEALPLIGAMADALAAAHAAGVIHRDFKSGNVMLVGARVVVTDFGLARPSERPAGGDGSLSSENALIGSPKYMAPEQVEGVAVTPAADVYALGVVAFEMVTGQVPFLGANPVQTALKRLTEPAPSPRRLVPSLPASWDAAIGRCLQREPSARFADPRAFVAALSAPLPPVPRRWGALLVAAAIAAALGGAGAWIVNRRAPTPPTAPTPAAARMRRAVAVVGFRNLSARPGDAWMSTAFGEMLATELGAGEEVRVAESEAVARMKKDLALADADRYAPETLGRIRQQLDVDWVVAGSYVVEPTQLRLEMSLQDARSGETVVTLSETASSGELIDLASHAGARLRSALGMRAQNAVGERQARAALPADDEAARLYAEAIVHRRASDATGARDLLVEALRRDPSFALAHSALGDVYLDLGLHGKARAEAERAFRLSDNLSREDRLLLEARYHKTLDDWPRAIELYRALFTFYPDDLSYGLQLARAQTMGGRNVEALRTVAELRKLPAPLADDPHIDRAEAHAWAKQGDWKHRLAADEHAIAKARAMGARQLVADAETGAAEALYYLGDVRRARATYEDAKRIYDAVGDKKASIGVAVDLADLDADAGQPAAARPQYEAAIAFHRENGDDYGIADNSNALAQTYVATGELARALPIYDEALRRFANIDEREGIGNVTSNVGDVYLLRGEPIEAEQRYRAALARFREVGMRTHEAAVLGDLAGALRRQGKLDESRARNAEGLAMLRSIGDQQKVMDRLVEEALRRREEDDLAGAERALAEAMSIARARGVASETRPLELLQAQAALDAGRLDRAEAQARALAGDKEAEAQELLARVLLAAGRRDAAVVAADRALALVDKSEARDLVWQVRTTRARAHGDCSSRALADVVAAAKKSGAVDRRLEAELARVEACHAPAAPLVDEARRLGFKRLARLAAR